MSEAEKGKASGWSAWYQNGKWVTDDKRKKPAAKRKPAAKKAAAK
jgi:DNA topoisomerase-1